jgi:hypothetical protein
MRNDRHEIMDHLAPKGDLFTTSPEAYFCYVLMAIIRNTLGIEPCFGIWN